MECSITANYNISTGLCKRLVNSVLFVKILLKIKDLVFKTYIRFNYFMF